MQVHAGWHTGAGGALPRRQRIGHAAMGRAIAGLPLGVQLPLVRQAAQHELAGLADHAQVLAALVRDDGAERHGRRVRLRQAQHG